MYKRQYVDAAYAEASIQIASEKLNESKRMLAKMKRLYELGEKLSLIHIYGEECVGTRTRNRPLRAR